MKLVVNDYMVDNETKQSEMYCAFCGTLLSLEKARDRRKSRKKNRGGKVYCGRECYNDHQRLNDTRHTGNKRCKICQEDKPKSEFYFANKEKTRYAAYCKQCAVSRSTEYHRSNPLRPDTIRRYEYGIEPEQYDAMLKQQSNVCAICGKGPLLCVDHAHVTGTFRG